ncbi:ABC transporter ATP-binding protein [Paenibacillus etheri]|uniref:Protein CR006 P-loop domain-containing protein n=1 Tax=Paenibacillus etheri TaxID=1306852 RepID=A0A0W1AQG0_9BACL|nr:ABC transporter ATP-binding protein [Paenibacillus etheri]KTD83577.1 hypothetical protein UQ64_01670 [Paenibacillus etheri]
MDKLTVVMKNCYGIKSLSTTFDFNKKNGYVLYASNGTMKTSFTKTFKQIKAGKSPVEEIFERKSLCEVKKSSGDDILPEEVFVIESYNENYNSEHVSNLLVNKDIQRKYLNVVSEINEKNESFITMLKQYFEPKFNIEDEIIGAFNGNDTDVLKLFKYIKDTYLDETEEVEIDFEKVNYSILFNEKTEKFLKDANNVELLKQYDADYNELMEKTTFYKKGKFSHYNANKINDSLKVNGFFSAEHHLLLRNGETIKSYEELIDIIQKEKTEILKDPKLVKKFEQIDKKLDANEHLRRFRHVIENDQSLISYLVDYDQFKMRAWITILKLNLEQFEILVCEYEKAAIQIKEISQIAAKENENWRKVVDIFTNRFYVPFRVHIKNQEEVVLRNSLPALVFEYHEGGETKVIEKGKLNTLLSGGERRALYLMNIIFEIEALKLAGKNVLVIADDIAESFDYKNKYAIIEYLKENVEHGLFNFLILTHNFDFYRTVSSRILDRNHSLMVMKKTDGIELIKGKYLKNIFNTWKDQLHKNDTILIASIPFIRNIVEYVDSEESDNYLFLTKLLHLVEFGDSKKTKEITIKELEDVINEVWAKEKVISKHRETKSVYNLVMDVCEEIYEKTETIDIILEDKVAISMGIRLLAEDLMMQRIKNEHGNTDEIEKIESNQTGNLLSLYKSLGTSDLGELALLEQVSLMTPENIHLNSFMYEPLIDISMNSLKTLYGSLKLIEIRELVIT